jgi:hypothetical protein
MGWWWNRRSKADVELFAALMHGQTEAAAQRTQIEIKRQDLELRRLELEFENLERVGEEKRREREAQLRLREQRREWANKSREALRQKRAALAGGAPGTAATECRVCRSPGEPTLTTPEITWHYNGHPQRAVS